VLFSSSHKIWGPHKLWRMAWSRAEAAKTKRPQLHMVRVLGPGACPCPCPCPLRRPRLAPPPATTTIRHPHPLTILTQKRHHSTTPSAVRSDETMTPAGACQRVRCLRTGEGGGGFPIPNLPSRAVPLAFSEKRERARLTFYIFTSLGSTSCEFPLSWSLLPSLPPVSTPFRIPTPPALRRAERTATTETLERSSDAQSGPAPPPAPLHGRGGLRRRLPVPGTSRHVSRQRLFLPYPHPHPAASIPCCNSGSHCVAPRAGAGTGGGAAWAGAGGPRGGGARHHGARPQRHAAPARGELPALRALHLLRRGQRLLRPRALLLLHQLQHPQPPLRVLLLHAQVLRVHRMQPLSSTAAAGFIQFQLIWSR
jgi:hypothetical protein